MTLDQIDQMVRQANPVPDLTVLEPVDASVLVFDQQRRMEMQTHDRVEVEQEQEKSRRGFLVGIAAIAAIVVGVLVFLRPSDGSPVAADQPVEVAVAFVEAYGAFDMDRAASYLADDADLSRLEAGVEGWHLGIRWLEATGFKVLLDSCEEEVGSSPRTVSCLFAFHAIRSDEIGLGPFGDSTFDFRILDGEIVAASMIWNIEEFGPQVWEPFAVWVAETHPEDVTIMYTGSSQSMQRFTDEAIALWDQRSREYVEAARSTAEAEAAATGFVEAYSAFDVDAATTYLAADADLELDGVLTLEDLPLTSRLSEAQGFKRMFDACERRETSASGTLVRCTYDFHSIGSDEIGLGPYTGNWFDLTVVDAKIVSVSDHIPFLSNGFDSEVWGPFADWIAETYPDDVTIMYSDARQTDVQLTEESIALWEQHTREYVEAVGG
jgi:hypothetical protein